VNKAQKLRELFSKEGLVRIAGAHDGITAKLVELNGFDGVWASGFEISTSYAVPCLLYTSPSPRDRTRSRMPSSA